MKFVSWNVNGLRAALKKGFMEAFESFDADFVCLQEIKLEPHQIDLATPGYEQFWNAAEKKGYSGTAIFARHEPLSVSLGLGLPHFDNEGRVITLEYPDFFLVNAYVPNSQDGLRRLAFRSDWEDAMRAYLCALAGNKGVVFCGDLNVAHQEIDLANPDNNHMNPGFTDLERGKFVRLLEAGFIDTFRYFEPERTQAYSWWSYRTRARERNVGWRIDYFLVSKALRSRLLCAGILDQVMGSDHCPVTLEISD